MNKTVHQVTWRSYPRKDSSAVQDACGAGRVVLRSCSPAQFVPSFEKWPEAGVYQLRVRLSANARVTIGRLGRFVFPAGIYVYTGRASRGLRARVLRHVRGASRKHWHIDYLLASRKARVCRVVLTSSDPEMECFKNQQVGRQGRCVAPGFGASDCRAGCAAHLWRCGA